MTAVNRVRSRGFIIGAVATTALAVGAIAFYLFGHSGPRALEPAPLPRPVAETAQKAERGGRHDQLLRYYSILKDREADYGKVGSVLEQLWAHKLQEENPNAVVATGLQYFDDVRTLGELDVVLFDTASDRVTMVAEVKLTGSVENALSKAREQILRFRVALEENRVATVRETLGDRKAWPVSRFAETREYLLLGSKETEGRGFDRAFDLTRDEGDILQRWLLAGEPEKISAARDDDRAAPSDAPASLEDKTIFYPEDFELSAGEKSPLPEGMNFVANAKTRVLHFRTCRTNLLPDNQNRIYFTTLDGVKTDGYKKHKCMKESGESL